MRKFLVLAVGLGLLGCGGFEKPDVITVTVELDGGAVQTEAPTFIGAWNGFTWCPDDACPETTGIIWLIQDDGAGGLNILSAQPSPGYSQPHHAVADGGVAITDPSSNCWNALDAGVATLSPSGQSMTVVTPTQWVAYCATDGGTYLEPGPLQVGMFQKQP